VVVAGQDIAADFLKRSGDPDWAAKSKIAFGFVQTAGAGAGMLAFGPLAARLGCRGTFAVMHVAAAILTPAVCWLPSLWGGYPLLLVLLPVFAFFAQGIHVGYAAYFPSLFPTHLRTTGDRRTMTATTPALSTTHLRAPAPGGPPPVGLGLWKIDKAAVAGLIEEALRSALAAGLCRRDELWVTSKLWNTFHAPRHVRPACERTLRDLGLDHLDLYLVHFPIALEYVAPETRYPPGWFFDPTAAAPRMHPARVPLADTWAALEELVQAGLVRHIGVCNYGVSLLRDLLSYARIRPTVLQVELHPYLAQEKLLRFCREEGIAVTAYSPLGAPSYVPLGMARETDSLLDHPTITTIASAVGRTPAQVLLRWGVQRGTSVIPKTSRPERLAENLAILDFVLSAEHMGAIGGLDAGRRFNDPGTFCERAFNTFFPIYE